MCRQYMQWDAANLPRNPSNSSTPNLSPTPKLRLRASPDVRTVAWGKCLAGMECVDNRQGRQQETFAYAEAATPLAPGESSWMFEFSSTMAGKEALNI